MLDRGTAQPGDVVKVIEARNAGDDRGRFIGIAHFSSESQITLRMLATKSEPADATFFASRLLDAISHRENIVENSDACRLVFSEADLLPGLIVDRYGPYSDDADAQSGHGGVARSDRKRVETSAFSGGISGAQRRQRQEAGRPAAGRRRAVGRNSGVACTVKMNGLTLRGRFAARPEDRNLSGSARKLRRGGAISAYAAGARARARLFHIDRRFRAASGGEKPDRWKR